MSTELELHGVRANRLADQLGVVRQTLLPPNQDGEEHSWLDPLVGEVGLPWNKKRIRLLESSGYKKPHKKPRHTLLWS